MKNNIILIGFMGCGKTSISIKLSYQMKRTMIDTDKWIEQKQKMSVSEIFDTYGEGAFRSRRAYRPDLVLRFDASFQKRNGYGGQEPEEEI